jgi:histidine triad (HIT) family protein
MTEASGAENCIFCRVVRGDFGTEFVAESDNAVAFRDLHPQAPTHVLVVPRRHIPALRDVSAEDASVAAELLALAVEVARREGLHEGGYRVTTNDGLDAGQTVFHLHFHVLGGHRLHEPLG